jgi:exopolysaccharide biosynthesis protein
LSRKNIQIHAGGLFMVPITGSVNNYRSSISESAPQNSAPVAQTDSEPVETQDQNPPDIQDRVSVAPGIEYQQGAFRGTPYHMVKINRNQADVTLKPYLTNKPAGESVLGMDKKTWSVATVNGTFFDTAHPGTKVFGEVKTDGGEYKPTMIKKRTYWGVKPDGHLEMGETTPAGRDPEGRTLYQIPLEKWNSFKYILGGGGRLVDDGKKASVGAGINDQQFMSDILAKRNRSALGFSADGGTFWMVSCDPPGWTPKDTADFFINLGAHEAMFLDGGGSTEMIVKDKIVTDLSADAERLMPTSVVAVPGKNTGESVME